MSKGTVASHVMTGGTAYHVEVRSEIGRPVQLMGKYYGHEWTRWSPEASCLPVGRFNVVERHYGLLSYEEAMAIAWMAKAYSENWVGEDSIGLGVRVVEDTVSHSFHAEHKCAHEPLQRHLPLPPKSEDADAAK